MTTDGYGTTLEYSTNESTYEAEVAGTDAWTELDNIDSVDPPEVTVANIRTSHLQTPGQTHTKKPSWKEVGDVAVQVQYDKTQHAALMALVGVEKGWKITLADDSTIHFNGFISGGLKPTADSEDIDRDSFTITTSGPILFTPAA